MDSALPYWVMDLHKSGQARTMLHGLWLSFLNMGCFAVRSSAGAMVRTVRAGGGRMNSHIRGLTYYECTILRMRLAGPEDYKEIWEVARLETEPTGN